jgi:hypothetical protein
MRQRFISVVVDTRHRIARRAVLSRSPLRLECRRLLAATQLVRVVEPAEPARMSEATAGGLRCRRPLFRRTAERACDA